MSLRSVDASDDFRRGIPDGGEARRRRRARLAQDFEDLHLHSLHVLGRRGRPMGAADHVNTRDRGAAGAGDRHGAFERVMGQRREIDRAKDVVEQR